MTAFAYLGIAVTMIGVWFAHEACKYIFRPYRMLFLNLRDWVLIPYLAVKIYHYSDVDLYKVSHHFNGKRCPIRVMKRYVTWLRLKRGI
jgi:hypothetical protein